MDLCLLRARRSILAASTLALFLTVLTNGPAFAQAPAAPAGQAAGQKQKNYKDRGEYDLYLKVTQTQDPKARLQVLNEWQDKYPQTDFEQDRLQYFVTTLAQLSGSDPSVRQQFLDKAAQLLKEDPNNFVAGYYTVLYGPAVPNANPDQIKQAAKVVQDNADKTFAPDKKPANMSADQWTQAKNSALGIADNALAFEAIQSKDMAAAENYYKQSLQANPTDSRIAAAFGKLLIDEAVAAQKQVPQGGTPTPEQQATIDQKTPLGLFEYARAASYDGPNSLPQAQRDSLMQYFKSTYESFHGSAAGEDDVISQAKASAVPPDNFTIQSANTLAQGQANKLNARIGSDPAFKIWYAVKQNLQEKGDAFFNSDVKGFEIPGGEEGGPKDFSGTVISLDPADAPTKVVIGVEDPATPDATLLFSTPLPADALSVIKVGQPIQFSGIADSYTATPYMLTFKDPEIPGVKTTTPAKKGQTRHRK